MAPRRCRDPTPADSASGDGEVEGEGEEKRGGGSFREKGRRRPTGYRRRSRRPTDDRQVEIMAAW